MRMLLSSRRCRRSIRDAIPARFLLHINSRIRVQHEPSERPAEAEARSRLGDWEAGAIVGPGGACLATLADRAPRPLVGGRAASRTCADVADVIASAPSGGPLETVAPDRGKESANDAEPSVGPGGAQSYLCEPHHPWRKGTNENANGLIGELFPKGTDSSRVTGEEVRRAFEMINGRPRKALEYRTANEAYREMSHSA